jgi:hypothetical protein
MNWPDNPRRGEYVLFEMRRGQEILAFASQRIAVSSEIASVTYVLDRAFKCVSVPLLPNTQLQQERGERDQVREMRFELARGREIERRGLPRCVKYGAILNTVTSASEPMKPGRAMPPAKASAWSRSAMN